MTINKIKKEYEKLGYEVSYDYRCWSINKIGTLDFRGIGCKESLEEVLSVMMSKI